MLKIGFLPLEVIFCLFVEFYLPSLCQKIIPWQGGGGLKLVIHWALPTVKVWAKLDLFAILAVFEEVYNNVCPKIGYWVLAQPVHLWSIGLKARLWIVFKVSFWNRRKLNYCCYAYLDWNSLNMGVWSKASCTLKIWNWDSTFMCQPIILHLSILVPPLLSPHLAQFFSFSTIYPPMSIINGSTYLLLWINISHFKLNLVRKWSLRGPCFLKRIAKIHHLWDIAIT